MGSIATVAAYKGGTGKTTIALELAWLLDACLLDLEWDAGASKRWGHRHERRKTSPLMNALDTGRTPRPLRGKRKADLVPGHPDLGHLVIETDDMSTLIGDWVYEWNRDWVVIDTHPGDNPVTVAAMNVADVVVVPLPLAMPELDGLEAMLEKVADLPLLVVPNAIPRTVPKASYKRLCRLAETYDFEVGPMIRFARGIGQRQQRMAISASSPIPARWENYVTDMEQLTKVVINR